MKTAMAIQVTRKSTRHGKSSFPDLSKRLTTSVMAFLRAAKALAPVWKREGLQKIRLKGALFLRMNQGTIVIAPLVLDGKPTKKSMLAKARIIGVIVN